MKRKHKELEKKQNELKKKQDYLVIFSADRADNCRPSPAHSYYREPNIEDECRSVPARPGDFCPRLFAIDRHSTAKVEIVEFFDPACDTCKEFFPKVKKLMADHPGKIRLYERYAPFHNGSIAVVKILAAAHMQGKFWQTLEAIFAAQSAWAPHHRPQPDLVWTYIGGVGLDMVRLRRDIDSPVMDKIVQQDLDDAQKLNVTATPEFFVNGKPLPSWGWEQLKSLVESELSAAY